MLKLLFIPTGNIFTLPDEEAIKIKKQDRGSNYKILDAGYQEEKEETVEPKTVAELVLNVNKRAEEIEKEDAEKEKKSVEKESKKEEKKRKTPDFQNMSKKKIVPYLKNVGIPAHEQETREVLFEKLKKAGYIK